MYEFHGWATIRVQDDDEDLEILVMSEKEAIRQLEKVIQKARDKISLFEVKERELNNFRKLRFRSLQADD